MTGDPEKTLHNINVAREYRDALIPDSTDPHHNNRTLMDIVLGGMILDLGLSFQLVGDALMDPIKQGVETERYIGEGSIEEYTERQELSHSMFELFRERINDSRDGWVDIIPFNDNLIFLKGINGEYDFVYKNQRNQAFEHQIFGKALKNADVPSCIQNYHFLRWHYFEYTGFRDKDEHEAEKHFYETEGKVSQYPGQLTVLRNYCIDYGKYSPFHNKSNQLLDGFFHCKINNSNMMISNLITIKDYSLFLNAEPNDNCRKYSNYRVGDNITSVNNENISHPAAVTWFDALAYINWLEEKTGVNIRLLKLDEYQSLREGFTPLERQQLHCESDLEFVKPDGTIYPSHPEYMAEDIFQSLTLRFKNTPNTVKGLNGLEFVKSHQFDEWLLEGTCIRSGNLMSFYNDPHILRSCPPKGSTGKYKGTKIGFRLCYELES